MSLIISDGKIILISIRGEGDFDWLLVFFEELVWFVKRDYCLNVEFMY